MKTLLRPSICFSINLRFRLDLNELFFFLLKEEDEFEEEEEEAPADMTSVKAAERLLRSFETEEDEEEEY